MKKDTVSIACSVAVAVLVIVVLCIILDSTNKSNARVAKVYTSEMAKQKQEINELRQALNSVSEQVKERIQPKPFPTPVVVKGFEAYRKDDA